MAIGRRGRAGAAAAPPVRTARRRGQGHALNRNMAVQTVTATALKLKTAFWSGVQVVYALRMIALCLLLQII